MKNYFLHAILYTTVLFANPSFANASPMTSWNEHFYIAKERSKIIRAVQKEHTLTLYTKNITAQETKRIEKQLSASRAIQTIRKGKNTIQLVFKNSHFGYVLSKEQLIIFQDTLSIQPVPLHTASLKKINTPAQKQLPVTPKVIMPAIQRKAKQTEGAQIKNQPQKAIALNTTHTVPKQFIAEQIRILETQTISPHSPTQYVRARIDKRNNTTILETISLATAYAEEAPSAKTPKQNFKINYGGPSEWKEEEKKETTQKTIETENNTIPNTKENSTSTQPIKNTAQQTTPVNTTQDKALQNTSTPQILQEPTTTAIPVKTQKAQAITIPTVPVKTAQEQVDKDSNTQNIPLALPDAPKKPVSQNTTLATEGNKKESVNNEFQTQTQVIAGMLNRKDYENALIALKNLRNKNIPRKEKESVLYLIADVSEVISRSKPEYISKTIEAFNEAMNFNTNSEHIPDALLQLGLLNASLGNTKETEAYFSLIRTKYPNHQNTPLTYYYLGKYFQDKKEYTKALVQYKTIEEKYSQFKYLQETIVEIIHTLVKLGYYKETKPYIEFIDSRWPNFYQTYPDILLTKAELYSDLQEYNKSLEAYWKYYNILPEAKNIDIVMAHIGDLYSKTGKPEKAKVIYESIIKKYPDTEGYLIAKMRLAEERVVDNIDDTTQFLSVFDKPYNTLPYDTYKEITTKYKDSALAPIAKAKLALWFLWAGDYTKALQTADEFKKEYPNNQLKKSINGLIAKTLDKIAVDDKMKKDIPILWKKYAPLFQNDESLEPAYRLHIAQALYTTGDTKTASTVLTPFFKGRKYPMLSEEAISLALDINNTTENWKAIEDIYYRVLDWNLPPYISSKVLFSTAMAFEKTAQAEKAHALWEKLFMSVFTPPYYKGVSAYYLAQSIAKAHKKPKDVYPFALESLNNLLLASKNKDFPEATIRTATINTLNLLRTTSQQMGILDDALRYTILQEQYEPTNRLLTIEKATLFKKMGNTAKWKEILEDIVAKEPNSLYGKLAKTELTGNNTTKKLKQFM